MDPAKGGYGNGVLKFPLDLSTVEDYFIPANGVYLDNVSPPHPCLALHPWHAQVSTEACWRQGCMTLNCQGVNGI